MDLVVNIAACVSWVAGLWLCTTAIGSGNILLGIIGGLLIGYPAVIILKGVW